MKFRGPKRRHSLDIGSGFGCFDFNFQNNILDIAHDVTFLVFDWSRKEPQTEKTQTERLGDGSQTVSLESTYRGFKNILI